MPLRYLRYRPPQRETQPLPPVEGQLRPVYERLETEFPKIETGRPPAAVGYKGSNEFLRTPANWYSIMERSFGEAVDKLKAVLKDLKVDPAPLDSIVPCIVDVDEGRTIEQKERIRRAHRKFATIFAHFFDRIVRYRPESRLYAFDSLTQDLQDSKLLWKDYTCEGFRTPVSKEIEKMESRKRKKK